MASLMVLPSAWRWRRSRGWAGRSSAGPSRCARARRWLAVTASVQAVPVLDLSAVSGHGLAPQEAGEGPFAVEPVGVVAGSEKQRAGSVRADAALGDQARASSVMIRRRLVTVLVSWASRKAMRAASSRSVRRVIAATLSSSARIRKAAQVASSSPRGRSRRRARRSSGAVTRTARSWLRARVRALCGQRQCERG